MNHLLPKRIEVPTEILLETVNHLSLSLADLARCARVNRAIGECALAVLYCDVNLNRADYMYRNTEVAA